MIKKEFQSNHIPC